MQYILTPMEYEELKRGTPLAHQQLMTLIMTLSDLLRVANDGTRSITLTRMVEYLELYHQSGDMAHFDAALEMVKKQFKYR